MMTAISRGPAPSLAMSTIVTADIRLIRILKVTVRLRICLFIVDFVRRGLGDLTESIFFGGNSCSALVSLARAASL